MTTVYLCRLDWYQLVDSLLLPSFDSGEGILPSVSNSRKSFHVSSSYPHLYLSSSQRCSRRSSKYSPCMTEWQMTNVPFLWQIKYDSSLHLTLRHFLEYFSQVLHLLHSDTSLDDTPGGHLEHLHRLTLITYRWTLNVPFLSNLLFLAYVSDAAGISLPWLQGMSLQ